MKSSLVLAAVCSLLLLSPTQKAHAWGDVGHRAVGKIAESFLTPQARKALEQIMGQESLARAATYPDEIRSDKSKGSRFGQTVSFWHFVEIPAGETYDSSKKNPNGDAYSALIRLKGLLFAESSTPEEKQEAVRWIAHLVGDIHMPLHVGNGKDRGANLCDIRWKEELTNLHSVIDDHIIDSLRLSYTELAEFILKTYSDGTPVSRTDLNEIQWVNESMALRESLYPSTETSNPSTYCKEVGSDGRVVEKITIPYDFGKTGHFEFIYKMRPLIEKRIYQAGRRLAEVFNQGFRK